MIFAMSSKQAIARVLDAFRCTSAGLPSFNRPIRFSTREAARAASRPPRSLITLQSTYV